MLPNIATKCLKIPMPNFSLNPNILLSPVKDGYIAFDVVDEKLHQLNPLAALLVELANGSRTVDELKSLVQPHSSQEAVNSIPGWLNEAETNGLLVRAIKTSNETAARDLSAEQLVELADRLRDEGKTQAAFHCQQQAAELSPNTADVWRQLGELSHIVGKRETARDSYQRYLEIHPDDAEIRHILVSLTDKPAPPRVPDDCIKHLYERFSTYYESNMCEELGYEGPQHLLSVIEATISDRRGLSILDLGCGTGLAGEVLRPFASRLIGVDLSEEMLAKAKARSIYDELAVGELTEWLSGTDESFDLIVACDTFIYFGDLQQTIGPAKQRLNPGGSIAFSVEQSPIPPFQLTDSGRYKHHFDHLCDTASGLEMQIASHREEFLRMEYGEEVHGHYVCLAQ